MCAACMYPLVQQNVFLPTSYVRLRTLISNHQQGTGVCGVCQVKSVYIIKCTYDLRVLSHVHLLKPSLACSKYTKFDSVWYYEMMMSENTPWDSMVLNALLLDL